MTTPADDRRPRTALLRHTPLDEVPHFDWLVVLDGDAPGPDDRTVPCFRLSQRLDLATDGSTLEARPLAAHRGLYLVLSAPRELSAGRGLVEPLRRGEVLAVRDDAGQRLIDLRWHAVEDQCSETLMRVRLPATSAATGGTIRLAVGLDLTDSGSACRAVAGRDGAPRRIGR